MSTGTVIKYAAGGLLFLGIIPAAITGGVGYAQYQSSKDLYATAEAFNTDHVYVEDPQDILSPSQEQQLKDDAHRIETIDGVENLVYLVFGSNDYNVNDTVERYMRDNLDQFIEKDVFADGVFIVGVGLSPRQAFVFAGEDVADTFDLRDNSNHLNASIDAMKEGVINNNIPAGLFASASQAVDVDRLKENHIETSFNRATNVGKYGGMIGGIGGLFMGIGVVNKREERRKKLEEARSNKSKILNKYTELSENLDEIDIRANSLSSPFIDKTLRTEWSEVRDGFIKYNDMIHGVGGIGTIADDDEDLLIERYEDIKDVADSVDHVEVAQKNINRLFQLERGDSAVRMKELSDMRSDLFRARGESLISPHTRSSIENIISNIELLMDKVEHDKFLEGFSLVLDEYNFVIQQVKNDVEREMNIPVRVEESRPSIWDDRYRYGGTVIYSSYDDVDRWHRENRRAEREYQEQKARESRSSSSSSSSFSSGFSGSGGSSRF